MDAPPPLPRPAAEDEARARRFVVRLAVLLAGFVAGAALLNAVIDPHGLFRWIDQPGLNHLKPRASQSPEAFKYRAIDAKMPRTLLLGNSRVEMGWDPKDLPDTPFGSVVNAAVPGRGLGTMAALADHAWQRSRPTHLLVGAEFFDCLASGPRPAPSSQPPAASPWSADQPRGSYLVRRSAALLEHALSVDTLADAAVTVLRQRDGEAPHLRDDGFQTARDYPAIVRVDGVRRMFAQREAETLRTRLPGPRSIRHADGTPSACFDALDRLLASARERGQTVLLATYPYHARLLEIIVQAGFLPAYEDWKRELVRVAERHRTAGGRVTLREFGGYHAYAAEPIAPRGVAARSLQWYWESGHFKASLGREMLAVMSGARPPEPGFGEELTPASVDARLAHDRRAREAFRAAQPEVVAEITAAIERER